MYRAWTCDNSTIRGNSFLHNRELPVDLNGNSGINSANLVIMLEDNGLVGDNIIHYPKRQFDTFLVLIEELQKKYEISAENIRPISTINEQFIFNPSLLFFREIKDRGIKIGIEAACLSHNISLNDLTNVCGTIEWDNLRKVERLRDNLVKIGYANAVSVNGESFFLSLYNILIALNPQSIPMVEWDKLIQLYQVKFSSDDPQEIAIIAINIKSILRFLCQYVPQELVEVVESMSKINFDHEGNIAQLGENTHEYPDYNQLI